MSAAKNPRTPPKPLIRTAGDVVEYGGPLWRIRWVTGTHVLPWNALREYGPAATMRWDPHPEPADVHAGVGVSYAAQDVTTTVAEVFQKGRRIRRTASQELVGWTPTRPLRLLNLSETWLVANGASASLAHGPKRTCRAWAAAIHRAWPDLDGLRVPSTWTGRPMVVLFSPAASTLPALPTFARLLNDPAASPLIGKAARELGWPVAS